MKYILLCFFLCHCCTYITSQNYSEDSALFSQKLEPFRKHLDSVAQDIDPTELVYLFQKPYSPDTNDILKYNSIEPIIAHTHEHNPWFPYNNISLLPPGYSSDELIKNDTSQSLFVEIGYPLPNRSDLLWCKSQFEKAHKTSDKIQAMLDYVAHLSRCYPNQNNWRFSESNTMRKYIWYLSSLFRTLPRDTIKCDLLFKEAEMLADIDMSWFRYEIYQNYVDARTILFAPYWDKLRDERLKGDTVLYNTYILKNNISTWLLKTYRGLLATLTPDRYSNVNNELYAIEKRKLMYLREMRDILRLAVRIDTNKKQELEEVELLILFQAVSSGPYSRARNIQNLFYDLDNLLASDLNALLLLPNETISEKKQFYLYLSLSVIFSNLRQNKYALKSIYKAYEVMLSANKIIQPDIFEITFYMATTILKKDPALLESYNPFFYDANNFCYFYELMWGSAAYRNATLTQRGVAIRKINRMRVLYFKGQHEYVKNILTNAKRYILNDTISSLANEYDLGFIYEELFTNNWIEPNDAKFAKEKEMDNAMIAGFTNPSSVYSTFDGNSDIAQQYGALMRIENQSEWKYYAANLKDSIAVAQKALDQKNALIIIKQTEIVRLGKVNSDLTDTINHKNKLLDTLTTKISNKNAEIDSLGKRIEGSIRRLTEITETNKRLKLENATLEKAKLRLLWAVIALAILAIGIITLTARKVIKLRKQSKHLKTTIEANKIAHETDLKYENEKVLREYGLKHEIVEICHNLKTSFTALIDTAAAKTEIIKGSLDLFKVKLEKLAVFANSYYLTLNTKNEYNPVDQEVKLSGDYVEIVKIRKNAEDYYFTDARSIKPTGIVLPPHLLNNFTKNAIEKGKVENKPLHIEVSDRVQGEEYMLLISDDGKGIGENFNIYALQEKSTGIRGILAQLEYFNSRDGQQYAIQLDNSSFINRASIENTAGTMVVLRFKPKLK